MTRQASLLKLIKISLAFLPVCKLCTVHVYMHVRVKKTLSALKCDCNISFVTEILKLTLWGYLYSECILSFASLMLYRIKQMSTPSF